MQFCRATSEAELLQILEIQQKNRKTGLSEEEIAREGFVTVVHDLGLLKEMNDASQHVLAKNGDRVIGYALVMHPSFRERIPILSNLFNLVEMLIPKREFLVMGQICIDKPHRGTGLFKKIYAYYQQELNSEYHCLVTEVATINQRSLQAHKHVGFETLYEREEQGVSWEVLIWNWQN